MILKRRLAGGTFILLLSICTLVTPLAEQPVQSRKTVNSAAALRSLERAIGLLSQSRWEQASFEARLGSTYDPMLADFPYIESLSLASSGAPRADILERVEYALADNFFWRSYDRREAVRLCAMLYAQTCRYTDALALVDTLKNDSCADADYIRLFSLYGLGRLDEARNLVEQSLDRWPFDSRFAKAFLQSESVQKPDRKTVVLAEKFLLVCIFGKNKIVKFSYQRCLLNLFLPHVNALFVCIEIWKISMLKLVRFPVLLRRFLRLSTALFQKLKRWMRFFP